MSSSSMSGGSGGAPYRQQQQQHDLFPQQQQPGNTSSDLDQWVRDRQRAFRDFERALFVPNSSLTPAVGSIFGAGGCPPLPPPSLFPNQFGALRLGEHNNFVKYDDGDDDDGCGNNMLSSRNNAQDDLSPKAKVTYDEDRFQVRNEICVAKCTHNLFFVPEKRPRPNCTCAIFLFPAKHV